MYGYCQAPLLCLRLSSDYLDVFHYAAQEAHSMSAPQAKSPRIILLRFRGWLILYNNEICEQRSTLILGGWTV